MKITPAPISRSAVFQWLAFLAPFVLWAMLIRPLYQGSPIVEADGLEFFGNIKNFLETIIRGVYPLWNPYFEWGRPHLYGQTIGDCNPFLYIILVFRLLGCSFGLAYYLYLILYFFVGVVGFYLLARRLFGSPLWAYVAMVLLMFSSLGVSFFNSNAIVLLFTAIVWFFYFLLEFLHAPRRTNFLGLIYSTMILAITYLPFYFLTFFLTVAVLSVVLFPRELGQALSRVAGFVRNYPLLVAAGTVCVGLSLLPGLLWFKGAGAGELFIGWRHEGAPTANVASMSLTVISKGGIIGQYTIHQLFSNLDEFATASLYIPALVFLFVLVGGAAMMSRCSVLLALTGVFLTMISMTDTTPVQQFLYDHVWYFKYFRNLHFLCWLTLPLFVLVAVDGVRRLVARPPRTAFSTTAMMVYLFAVHGAALWYLLRFQENIIFSTYLVMGLSVCFFSLWTLGILRPGGKSFLMLFLLIAFLQPCQVFWYLAKNTQGLAIRYDREPNRPQWRFVRPEKERYHIREQLYLDRYSRNRADRSGLEGPEGVHRYIGLKRSFELHENIPHEILQEYVRYKFVVYDNVQRIADEMAVRDEMAKSFADGRNLAFVSDAPAGFREAVLAPDRGTAQTIMQNTEQFQVVRFDLNEVIVRTNFPTDKFLVYNDSFHNGWHAFINGKEALLVRANWAFKGLWIPAGENVVRFRFGTPLREIFQFALLAIFFGLFSFLTGALIREEGRRGDYVSV